jgi:hypothetical protein
MEMRQSQSSEARRQPPALFARLSRWARRPALWASVAGLLVAGAAPAGEKDGPPAQAPAAAPALFAPPSALPPLDPLELPAPGGEESQEAVQQDEGGAKMLERPLDTAPPETVPVVFTTPDELPPVDPPYGFAGRSSILPRNDPTADFVPMEDRWRIGGPTYDRYDRGHAIPDDYPGEIGSLCDPFQQNVIKGDYPIMGQNTFLNITGSMLILVEGDQTPVAASGGFESTTRENRQDFFGSPNQLLQFNFFSLTFDLSHGDSAFKPTDWRIHFTPVFNVNNINADELAFVNPNVARGTQRNRAFGTLQEYFVESKLMDTSANYDFMSVRAGSQFFVSDFRGFLFSDINRAVRLFGSQNANSFQYNLVYFRQAEKDTNSALNTFGDRKQNILIGNIYQQDFIFPGNTVTASIHYNNDPSSNRFSTNSFRVRPEVLGNFQPHSLDVIYLGVGSEGHLDRYNLMTQFYVATGHDSFNALANRSQTVLAEMAAAELSYDRDWARFRLSAFFSSGDHNTNNCMATGFDTIFDNPNFAGGGFSYWQRQGIGLFATDLKNRNSLVPDLRSSKIQGQSNFVNPGLFLLNLGMDFDLTPKLALIFNTNFLWFENTSSLQTFTFEGAIPNRIGTDISVGFNYRPLASNNIQFSLGIATLIPGAGFKALYNNKDETIDPLVAAFLQSILLF